MAERLANYESAALKDARFWLEREVRRISERTGQFFGEKTAVSKTVETASTFGLRKAQYGSSATPFALVPMVRSILSM
ncbi:hypothetical protein BLL42_28360 (plasmid) [Pseudomonas frederiksbergensis]|uniref:Uncharacterized protein n=1 Tax=Pseudomonas frederiksbergensis TaxID=104087 RepID=A0A1J0EU54_9PSED|nr:hypothetical protein BLL42_28360 [Pseudomonas frederiksbergensis]